MNKILKATYITTFTELFTIPGKEIDDNYLYKPLRKEIKFSDSDPLTARENAQDHYIKCIDEINTNFPLGVKSLRYVLPKETIVPGVSVIPSLSLVFIFKVEFQLNDGRVITDTEEGYIEGEDFETMKEYRETELYLLSEHYQKKLTLGYIRN